jgi:ribosome-binding protein aMBF1 (putative translation factor)
MKPKRIQNKTEWTAEDKARHAAIRERFKNKPTIEELIETGELRGEPIPQGDYLSIRQAILALKCAREEAGLSLTDLAQRSGIDRAQLSRIENGQHGNPTVSTLCRYAQALGLRWVWSLERAETGVQDTSPIQ